MDVLATFFDFKSPVTWIIIFIIAWFIWQLITRVFKLWYFKIDRIVENQERTIELLEIIAEELDKKKN